MPGKPTYLRIVDHYRAAIQAGQLKKGDWLPTQKKIMEAWECSEQPVRTAIKVLEAEGLIESMQGVGARVL